MFDFDQRSSEISNSARVGLLILAVLVFPALLFASRPIGYLTLLLGLACSILYVILACLQQKKSPALPASYVAIRNASGK